MTRSPRVPDHPRRRAPRTRPAVLPPGAARPRPVRTSATLRGAALLAAALLLAPPAVARADGCDGCPPPTLEGLRGVQGFRLEWRTVGGAGPVVDHVETDAGECVGHLEGQPEVTIEDAWLVLRGEGEVWNCPHSKSVDTIAIQSSASDRSDWSFQATVGVDLGSVAAKLKTEVEAGRTGGTTVTEVTQVSKQIFPAFCHRIGWKGYFEVVRLRAVGTWQFQRRWAWWTKNALTGATVHAKGEIWVDCGSGELAMGRRAPVSGHFELAQRGCAGESCGGVVPKALGMFPPFEPPPAPGADAPEDGDPPLVAGGDGQEPAPQEPPPPAPEDGGEPAATEPSTSSDLPEPPAGSTSDEPPPSSLPGTDDDR